MIFRRKDNSGFESTSVWGWLTSPFRSFGRFFSGLLEGDDSINVEQSLTGRIVGIFTLPFRFCLGIMVFMVQAWTSSRPGYAFVRAIPAMAVMMGFFIALLAADYIHNETRRISTNLGYYNFQIKRSPDHPEYAEVFAEKLLILQPENPNNKYELARVLDLKGESFRAVDIMKSLAPDDHAGLAKAHIWLANYYIRQSKQEADSPEQGSSQDELIRKHLAYAIETSPDNQSAHYTLANLDIDDLDQLEKGSDEYREKLKSAIGHLIKIADADFTRETIDLQLAVIPKLLEFQTELGDEQAAVLRLRNELNRLNALAERLPDESALQIRKVMVRTAMSVKDYDRAIQFIQEAQKLAKTDDARKQLGRLFSLTYRQRAGDFVDMNNRAQYLNRLSFLCRAVRFNPWDPIAGEQILDFIVPGKQESQTIDDPDQHSEVSTIKSNPSEVRLDWLRAGMTDSGSMNVIHVLLGIHEISKGKISEGEKHWRIADKLNPRGTQLIVNQLIQAAANLRPDEFSNELDMFSLAIELFPDQPFFYQTRGIYLQNLERYEEAVTDLSYASEKRPDLIMLHRHLITCYEELGEDSKVLDQQALFQEKLSQLDGPARKQIEAEIERRKKAR